MRFLVTGGVGFIGGHLVDALLALRHDVVVLDDRTTGGYRPPGARIVAGSITDAALVARLMGGMDGCFHLAAISSVVRCREEYLAAHQVNLDGALNVFDAAWRAGVPVVYASTAAVYGDLDAAAMDEDLPCRPINAYGVDKLAMELHARVLGQDRALRSFGLRLFNVYGPRQDPSSPYSGVVSIFMDRFRRRAPVTINGDGEQTRDFVAVADVIPVLVAAQTRAGTDAPVCNVGRGRAISINQLADAVARANGVADAATLITHGPPRPGDIRRSIAATGRLKRLIGLVPATELATGLAVL